MDTAVQRDCYRETGTVKKRIENYWNGRSDSFMEQRAEKLHSGQHQIWAEELLYPVPELAGRFPERGSWSKLRDRKRCVFHLFSDGDTLTMALQSGEIDAAYGLPYASYPIFENDGYTFTGCAISRVFFGAMNFESEITGDPAVRKAIAMGIDKEGFVETLLGGNGYPAAGVYPDSFPCGQNCLGRLLQRYGHGAHRRSGIFLHLSLPGQFRKQ